MFNMRPSAVAYSVTDGKGEMIIIFHLIFGNSIVCDEKYILQFERVFQGETHNFVLSGKCGVSEGL